MDDIDHSEHISHMDHRRPELAIGVKELAGVLVILGSVVSAWVSLNNSQVETDTRLTAFEKYYKESLIEYRLSNEKATMELKLLITEQKKMSRELSQQVNDLERSVSQIYQLKTRK